MSSEKQTLWFDKNSLEQFLPHREQPNSRRKLRELIWKPLSDKYEIKITDVVYHEIAMAHINIVTGQPREGASIDTISSIMQFLDDHGIVPVDTRTMKQVRNRQIPTTDAGDISIKEVFDRGIAGRKDKIASDDIFFNRNNLKARTMFTSRVANSLLIPGGDFTVDLYEAVKGRAIKNRKLGWLTEEEARLKYAGRSATPDPRTSPHISPKNLLGGL